MAQRTEARTRRPVIAIALAGLLAALGVYAAVAWGAATTVRVSVKSNGTEVNADNDAPSISRNGRYIAFQSVGAFTPGDAGTDGDVFVRDVATGKTRRASVKSPDRTGVAMRVRVASMLSSFLLPPLEYPRSGATRLTP